MPLLLLSDRDSLRSRWRLCRLTDAAYPLRVLRWIRGRFLAGGETKISKLKPPDRKALNPNGFKAFRFFQKSDKIAKNQKTHAKKAHNFEKVCEKAVDALRKKGCVSMVNIRENTKNGKVVQYIKDAMAKAIENATVRKGDVKSLK